MTELDVIVGVLAALAWVAFAVVDRIEERIPMRARPALEKVDIDDPRTVEEVREAYARARITEAEMERRLEVSRSTHGPSRYSALSGP